MRKLQCESGPLLAPTVTTSGLLPGEALRNVSHHSTSRLPIGNNMEEK